MARINVSGSWYFDNNRFVFDYFSQGDSYVRNIGTYTVKYDSGNSVSFKGKGFSYKNADINSPNFEIKGTVTSWSKFNDKYPGGIKITGLNEKLEDFANADKTRGNSDDFKVWIKMFDGNDLFHGGRKYGDHIHGYKGNDKIFGYGGNDKLYGEQGNDILVGGMGQDVMYGDGGKDVFIFRSIKESPFKTPDTIMTFDHREGDKIDLRAIDADVTKKGNQAFDFIDKEPYSGEAGELRQVGGYFEADVNGDGRSDFRVLHGKGLTYMHENDFLL